MTDIYACSQCGMVTWTDDLAIIGRNCWATEFERAHVMHRHCVWPCYASHDCCDC